jgi:hypothetical protein
LHQFARIIQVLLLSFLFLPCLIASGIQQNDINHHLGVYLAPDELGTVTSAQLEQLERLGFTLIELEGTPPQSLLNSLSESEFYILATQSRRFVTSFQLQQYDSLYFRDDLSLIRYYSDELGGNFAGIGMFIYPNDKSSLTLSLMDRYADRFSDIRQDGLLIYYRTAYTGLERYPTAFSFLSSRLADGSSGALPVPAIHFTPADTTLEALKDLKGILELSLKSDQSMVLIPHSWLIDKLGQFELLEDALKAYTQNHTLLFPEPGKSETPPSPNWSVVLLILLLGSYLIHYRSNQVYQRSLFRYFGMHKFFLDDILEYRLRTSVPATVLFFQHIFITGLLFYLFAATVISPLGLESLYYHFPFLHLFGSGVSGFFFAGMFIALILQTVSILWISLLSNKARFSQAATLYCWPLQLNLPVVIAMTAVHQAGGADFWLIAMAALFVIIWFLSFNIAALNIASYQSRFRILYIIFTVGIHLVIMMLLAFAALYHPPVSEPLQMAISLP